MVYHKIPGMERSSRNRTADLLKGVAIVLMVQVHLMELFARQDIFDSLTGRISLFLGGPPAAPVFMAVMGYYVALSGKTAKQMIIRGVKLILLGFALNIGLNFHLLINIYTGSLQIGALVYIFGVDILFLAGLSIIILALMKKFVGLKPLPFIFTLVFFLFLRFLLQQVVGASTQNYFIAFFYGEGAWWSYFPLIPWLVYPLTGYLFYILQKYGRKKIRPFYYYIVGTASLATVIFFNYGLKVSADLLRYYHHGFVFYLYTLCFLIFWLFLANIISGKPENIFSRFMEWLGRNVTVAYVVQWLIIGNIATSVYKTQGKPALAFWFVFVMILTSLGVWMWNRIKLKSGGKHILKI